jgi:prevent-host-death family protein
MQTITVRKAKVRLSSLIEKACQGEEIVIVRGSKPVVRLVAIEDRRGDRKPGELKGKMIKIGPRFFEPLTPEELGRWE